MSLNKDVPVVKDKTMYKIIYCKPVLKYASKTWRDVSRLQASEMQILRGMLRE